MLPRTCPSSRVHPLLLLRSTIHFTRENIVNYDRTHINLRKIRNMYNDCVFCTVFLVLITRATCILLYCDEKINVKQ